MVVVGHAIVTAAVVSHSGPGYAEVAPGAFLPKSGTQGLVLSLVYSFQMALFAFVSGILMRGSRKRPLAEQIGRRAWSLLVPYVLWFVITWFVAVGTWPLRFEGLGDAMRQLMLGTGPGLWYLYALFISSVVVYVLERLPASKYLLAASALAACWVMAGGVRIPVYAHLGNLLWIHPFIVFGYLMAPAREWVIRHRWPLALGSFVAFVATFRLRHPYHVPKRQHMRRVAEKLGEIGLPIGVVLTHAVYYLCGAAGSIAVYALYIGRTGRLIRLQAWFGRRSLGIYAVHSALLPIFIRAHIANAPVIALVSFFSAAGLTYLLERTPILGDVLLGQRTHRRGVLVS